VHGRRDCLANSRTLDAYLELLLRLLTDGLTDGQTDMRAGGYRLLLIISYRSLGEEASVRLCSPFNVSLVHEAFTLVDSWQNNQVALSLLTAIGNCEFKNRVLCLIIEALIPAANDLQRSTKAASQVSKVDGRQQHR
jgi:hypothetical protein